MTKGHPWVLFVKYEHICSQVFHFASVALTAAVHGMAGAVCGV